MTQAPLSPYWVLTLAILLPGMGHVAVGAVRRGLVLQVFMILGAVITWHLSNPQTSLAGRLAGGLFVYALSLPEAYRLARVRYLSASRV